MAYHGTSSPRPCDIVGHAWRPRDGRRDPPGAVLANAPPPQPTAPRTSRLPHHAGSSSRTLRRPGPRSVPPAVAARLRGGPPRRRFARPGRRRRSSREPGSSGLTARAAAQSRAIGRRTRGAHRGPRKRRTHKGRALERLSILDPETRLACVTRRAHGWRPAARPDDRPHRRASDRWEACQGEPPQGPRVMDGRSGRAMRGARSRDFKDLPSAQDLARRMLKEKTEGVCPPRAHAGAGRAS